MFMAQVTKKDIKEAVNTQVEKEFLASAEKHVRAKQMQYYKKPDEVIDLCPYCNENRSIDPMSYSACQSTPCDAEYSKTFSDMFNAPIYLKLENFITLYPISFYGINS